MRIIALNSSPRDNDTSITERVLQRVLGGARQAGAAAETLYLRQYHILHCLGCFGCWFKTPGKCVQPDDMTNILLPKFLEADLVILASPTYCGTVNARMKMFMERLIPLMDPTKLDKCDMDTMVWRVERFPRIVSLSVCMNPDQMTFQVMSQFMRYNFAQYLVAEIYRHSSEMFAFPQLAEPVEAALAAAERAGAELVRLGRVEDSTMADLTRDLAPKEELLGMCAAYFQQVLAQIEDKS